jgi:uncharacterized cupin superfamily protein
MEKTSIDDVDAQGPGGADLDRRALTGPLGTTDLAINYYRLDPGEGFSGGLHAHLDQEEVFYVIEGTATFETMADAGDEPTEVTVDADEAVRFAPGEYQSGRNAGDEPVVALALGAPRDSEDVRVPQECRDCGHESMRAVPGDGGFTLVCPECGTEVTPN